MALTAEQKLRIRCVKEGHAPFLTVCLGYHDCGRCGQTIGDSLGGAFSIDKDDKKTFVVGHKDKQCSENRVRFLRTGKKEDIAILKKLEAKP